MTIRQTCFMAAGFCIATGIATAPAQADVKLTQHMTIDSPQLKKQLANIPAQYRSMALKFTDMTNTISVSGAKVRMDLPMLSLITDSASDKMTQIYTFNRTYYVTKFDPTVASQILNGPAGHAQSGDQTDYEVTDTGKTSTLIGHAVHEFILTAKYKDKDGSITNMKSDIWAAQDMALPDMAGFGALQASSGKTKVTGIPLSTLTTFTGGPSDGTTLKQDVTAISTDPLPDSTFSVPDGYTQTTSPMLPQGGTGGPPTM